MPGLLRFVVARLFYTDPINTVIAVMSLFTINAIGFTEGEARLVLIGLTVVAVIASFGWGWLADRWGPKRTLVLVLVTLGGGPAARGRHARRRCPSWSPAPSWAPALAVWP